MKRADAVALVENEADRATEAFADFASMHEAIGVLREEYVELEGAVFMRQNTPERAGRIRAEAAEVAAVALRIIEQADRVLR